MSQLVNLRQVKKRIARDEAAKVADTNRARFGRTKAEKSRDDFNAEQAKKAVEQHRMSEETAK